ncbi:MAG TPA: M3 family oligoendopeptidase [Chloroflexota bacterium]
MSDTIKAEQDISWNLDDLYLGPEDPGIDADLARAGQMARDFAAAYRGRIAALAPEELLEALRREEAITTVAYKPSGYASLAFSAQTQDPKLQALVVKTREALTKISNETIFFDVELKRMDDAGFARFVDAPELATYRHHLLNLRAFAPHTLSEAEEKVVAEMRLTGSSAWSQLYTEITSSLRFPVVVEGEEKLLTDPEVRALRTRPDRDLRKHAGESLYSVYEANSRVLTYVFNTLFQDHRITIGLRSYATPIEPTTLSDELSPELVELLMSSVEAHYGLVQEYYGLKAKLLGLEGDFRYHDVLTPFKKDERAYEFSEGRGMVLSAFREFHPTMADVAGEFFEGRWIDATPRQGKRGGAFCSGLLPAYHPYVLTNFTGRLEDVFTVAHELGHGVHFSLARRQTPLNFSPTTPMAEVASVFGEILLAKTLREREPDPSVGRDILGSMIEDAIATIFRQVMYTRWEQKAHERRAEGVATAEEYSTLWKDENRRLYGDSVAMDDLDRWGWISIPHFVRYRFYCYSYAFGHLLVFALYRRYLEEGPVFASKYLDLLASGGSDRPEVLLSRMGLNPLDPNFWNDGFQLFEQLLDEFRLAAAA